MAKLSSSRSTAFLAFLALTSLATAPLVTAACGSDDSAAPGSSDAGSDAGIGSADAADDNSNFLIDSPIGARCTLPNLTDPVGLCVQKQAIMGEHAEFSTTTGLPSAWSVDTLLPETADGGAVIHDVRDDIGYGASLAEFYVSATAYGDPDGLTVVTGDMDAVARLLETELATLPADYDGAPYLRLRRLAAGLRLAGFATDADAIDVLAGKYGRAIYTTYFHALSPGQPPADAGADGSVEDGGAPEDAAVGDAASDAAADAAGPADASAGDAGSQDAGTPLTGDGILGTAAGGGFAYDVAKAASGALALVDMAARANGFPPSPADAGVDASAPPDPTDALAWSQAAGAVFNHLASRARDVSGMYFTQLQTSGDPGHDTVTDGGELASGTQGAVALSFVRAARLVGLAQLTALPAPTLVHGAVSALGALEATSTPLWDPASGNLTLNACNAALPPVSPCGSGYFAGIDATQTTLDARKGIAANALLLDALHRASAALPAGEASHVTPLLALFTFPGPPGQGGAERDGFFTQVTGQVDFVSYVTATFALTQNEDGGLPEIEDGGLLGGAGTSPLARYYSAAATATAIAALNDQWIGAVGAPAFFQ